MPDFKAYLRNFSKTLGILKPFEESVEYNFTQSNNDVIAPFDGYLCISVDCSYYWINTPIADRSSPVIDQQYSSLKGNRGSTVPIKKGRSYHIETNWSSGRYHVVLYPLMNTN